MKKYYCLTILLINIYLAGISQSADGVAFEKLKDWETVLREAKNNGKYIFVEVGATWCAPCKAMDDRVFADKKVKTFMDANFVSIKLQIDTTEQDDRIIKFWRNKVIEIQKSTNIKVLPTYLFYTQNGYLLYKTTGYQEVEKFLTIARFAIDSTRRVFKDELSDYQRGIKNYRLMPALIKNVCNVLEDRALAIAIAKDYKENFLDKLNPADFFARENLDLILENGDVALLNTHDVFFKTAYYEPMRFDSILGKGAASYFSKAIISRTEIMPMLFNENEPLSKNPNWKFIENWLANKYAKINRYELMLNEKVVFYKKIQNWDLYSIFKTEQLIKYPPPVEGWNVFQIYNGAAWELFLKCNEKKVLLRALKWSEWSIELETQPDAMVQCLDTKAHLLYKLGKITDAIQWQDKALQYSMQIARQQNSLSPGFLEDYLKNVYKMKNGIHTW
jgi:thioredoxin-related protein